MQVNIHEVHSLIALYQAILKVWPRGIKTIDDIYGVRWTQCTYISPNTIRYFQLQHPGFDGLEKNEEPWEGFIDALKEAWEQMETLENLPLWSLNGITMTVDVSVIIAGRLP